MATSKKGGKNGTEFQWTMKISNLLSFWMDAYPLIIGKAWEAPEIEKKLRNAGAMKETIEDLLQQKPLSNLDITFHPDMLVTPLPGIGYNFLISQAGLHLPLPRKPNDQRPDDEARNAIYRMYQYRSVGEPLIRIPRLDIPVSAPFIESGPWYPSKDDRKGFFPESAAGPGDTGGEMDELAGYEGPVDMSLIAAVLQGAGLFDGWSMEGGQFAALTTAYPRIVAHSWLDDAVYQSGSRGPGESSFTKRLMHGNGSSDGNSAAETKLIFEERIESTFDRDMELNVTRQRGLGCDKKTESFVSNRGIHLGLPEAPDLDCLYTSWANGWSGNPVFTMST